MDKALRRIKVLSAHITPPGSEACAGIATSNDVRWNGWGFADTEFAVNDDGHVLLAGSRYELSGVPLPHLRPWMEDKTGVSLAETAPPQDFSDMNVPPARLCSEFMAAIEGHYKHASVDDRDRVHHSHGHTCDEIFRLRYGSFDRVVDAVVWPASHEDVEVIVAAATAHNVCIIPFGGGTSVANGVTPPSYEDRPIVSLDMHAMNKIKWVNKSSMLACIEAGIVGVDLEARLTEQYGVTMGHEPDSIEFSTLGGWVSTRASGMRKNVYGNIEDIVVSVRCVTPKGVIEYKCDAPRISAGPSPLHMVLGHEGTLGVVTEVVVRVSPLPHTTSFGAVLFPDFETGVAFMHDIARAKCAPASIRLMDNDQFQLGQSLKPDGGMLSGYLDMVKKWYVTVYQGFDVNTMVAATLKFEGRDAGTVKAQEAKVYALAAKHGGMKADATSGRRGYALTFMIAYIRDLGMQHWFLAESFETSMPWDKVLTLCTNVKARVREEVRTRGIPYPPFVTCRVTQTYDTGACVYFYIGFKYKGVDGAMQIFNDVEHAAREEIIANGGSISHHHGVGKHRIDFMGDTYSEAALAALRAVKGAVDPTNVFAAGNLFRVE